VAAAASGGLDPIVSVPAPGLLLDALTTTGTPTIVLPVPVLRRSVLSPGGLARLAAELPIAVFRLVRWLRSVDAGVIYVNTLTCPAWLIAARLAGIRCVVHVHEAEESLPRLVRMGLTLPLLLADSVIVNSTATEQSLVRNVSRLASRIKVIYNGVTGAETSGLRNRGRQPARLLLTGRLSPRKGTDIAIAAVGELVTDGVAVELDLVGDVFPGYEWYAEQVRQQVQAGGLNDVVRFHGFRPDVQEFLDGADVCLVPSRQEPFGNVAVEAMLAGRPVVASRVQGLTEIVRHKENGLLVAPDNPAELAAAVKLLVDDESLAQQLATSARYEAQERFSIDRYNTSLRTHLQSLQDRPRRRVRRRAKATGQIADSR
jgi:hypothetical protein